MDGNLKQLQTATALHLSLRQQHAKTLAAFGHEVRVHGTACKTSSRGLVRWASKSLQKKPAPAAAPGNPLLLQRLSAGANTNKEAVTDTDKEAVTDTDKEVVTAAAKVTDTDKDEPLEVAVQATKETLQLESQIPDTPPQPTGANKGTEVATNSINNAVPDALSEAATDTGKEMPTVMSYGALEPAADGSAALLSDTEEVELAIDDCGFLSSAAMVSLGKHLSSWISQDMCGAVISMVTPPEDSYTHETETQEPPVGLLQLVHTQQRLYERQTQLRDHYWNSDTDGESSLTRHVHTVEVLLKTQLQSCTWDQIEMELIAAELSFFNATIVDALIVSCPTKEEVALLQELELQPDSAESFMLQLSQVPNVLCKLAALQAYTEIDLMAAEIEEALREAHAATIELLENASLQSVLQLIHVIGQMSQTTDYDALTFQSMRTLTQMEFSNDNDRGPFLEYIVCKVDELDPQLHHFVTQLSNTQQVVLQADLWWPRALSHTALELQDLQHNLCDKPCEGKFAALDSKLQQVVQQCLSAVFDLRQAEASVVAAADKTVQFYGRRCGEGTHPTEMLQALCVDVSTLCADYSQFCNDSIQ